MCVNFIPVIKPILTSHFDAPINDEMEWKSETWKDYAAPIIIEHEGHRLSLLGLYSMVPKAKMPPGVKQYSTLNARAETIGQLRSYAKYWRQCQLCLVPMTGFFEPNYESGAAVRWRIGMADDAPFAVAGLYRTWQEADGTESASFTQITINADDHPLMRRFHKLGDEKRSLVIVAADEYDEWLGCKDPEMARALLQPYPASKMAANAAPIQRKVQSASLF